MSASGTRVTVTTSATAVFSVGSDKSDGSSAVIRNQGTETLDLGSASVTSGALRIGGNSVWGEYFRGSIDEVRIYNRALSGGEIQTDMGTPIP